MRSAVQTEQVLSTRDPALKVNGDGDGPVSAEWMIPKALWLKQHEPSVFARARHICEYQDFINFHLTGKMCASLNNISIRWHYRISECAQDNRNLLGFAKPTVDGYPKSLLQALDLEELLHKWPQAILRPGDVVGTLTSRAAEHLGLSEDTVVVQGGADAFIGMIGLGALSPGSAEPSQ
eukprot:scaffold735_cov376-Prasinococcus_capsulatus_cf.AAC.25